MLDLIERDYFTDHSILLDPYAYFEALRGQGPVYKLPDRDVMIVTGFEEALEVLKNNEDFSSLITIQGPGLPLPFVPDKDDITDAIAACRDTIPGGDSLVTRDGISHSFSRALLSRLFTPSKLKANEAFMKRYADEVLGKVVAKGSCELIRDIATPFVTLVIADLLGVPDEDSQQFMEFLANSAPAGNLDSDTPTSEHPLVYLAGFFVNYVADRRQNPRDDVLTDLALAKFPDGSTPDLAEIVRLSTFLFAAGQDTSAKLLGNSMRYLCEWPGLQDRMRADPSKIPAMIEEVLRMEGSTKMTARLAKRATKIGDLDVPVGTRVMISFAAANRDGRRWEDPQNLVLDRPRIKEHVAFGRGSHVCIGAPLARAEVRVILEKFLETTSNISIDEEFHGPRGARRLAYEPSFIIRGLENLHLKLTPR